MSASNRTLIAKLSRASQGGIITVLRAASIMEVPPRKAALKLAALARQGWLSRARRGMYLIVPLEVEPGQQTIAEDPWVLARQAFSPCYIGGWSAAEHWGLTEQLFRSTLVVTATHVRQRSRSLLGHAFLLFKVSPSRITGKGITLVWRGAERVSVSNAERTIVDCLRNPRLCGGIRNLADLMREYDEREDKRFDLLLREAQHAASGAAWKRLGFLAELLWPNSPDITSTAKKHLTEGNIHLDPAVRRRGKLATRWRLWVNIPIPLDSGA